MSSVNPAMDFSSEEKEEARKLFLGPCDFFFGTQKLEQMPDSALPEVAFAGRSNVGKSSLLNALTNRNALARVSSHPGRTQQLNFFNLGDRLALVDMPGYGFAKVSEQAKLDWQSVMFAYLRGRPQLKRIYLLVDARVGLKAVDKQATDVFDKAAINYQMVLTKIDDVKPTELEKRRVELNTFLSKSPAAFPGVMEVSSRKNINIDILRASVAQIAEPAQK